MSIAIYYAAYRSHPITSEERAAIDVIVRRYSVDAENRAYVASGKGLNWESFHVYDPVAPSEPRVIFEGATRLPDNTENTLWTGIQHWCRTLSEIRQVLPGTTWHIHVDDHDIAWDDERGVFDPSL